MKITVNHSCADFTSYRAERVKSLFNVESGANFSMEAQLDVESAPWQIGVIVGPSGRALEWACAFSIRFARCGAKEKTDTAAQC